MLKDETEKKINKKKNKKTTQVKLRSRLCDWDNLIKKQIQNYEALFTTNPMLK